MQIEYYERISHVNTIIKCAKFNGIEFRICNGYYRYLTRKGIIKYNTSLHCYIYEFYNGPIPNGYEIHHIDFNKTNNSIDNLQLLTKKEHGQIHYNFKNFGGSGDKNGMYGKKHSKETKEKMKKPKSEEFIKNHLSGKNNPMSRENRLLRELKQQGVIQAN